MMSSMNVDYNGFLACALIVTALYSQTVISATENRFNINQSVLLELENKQLKEKVEILKQKVEQLKTKDQDKKEQDK